VSLDPELSRRALQEEERAFQIWYPPSFLRVLGADSIVSALGPLHRHIRALVLRLFGPESLRLVLLRDVQRSARTELRSWLRRPGPGVDVRAATSRVCRPCVHSLSAFNPWRWKVRSAQCRIISC
jgi:cytochrome P450